MAIKCNMEINAIQNRLSSNKIINLPTSYTPVYQRNGGSYIASTASGSTITSSNSYKTTNTRSNLSAFNKSSALPTLKLEPMKSQGLKYSCNVRQSIPKIPSIPNDKPIKTNLISNIFSYNSNRGYALILNHYKYEEDFQSTREGTQFDVDKLINVFAHFKIETIVRSDLRLSQIKSEVNNLKMKDFSKYKCFIVVILTHGNRNQYLCASDKSYNFIDEIENPLIEIKTLVDVPKIFMIQACRGNDQKFVFETDSESMRRRTNLYKRNIFKCNATYEGYVSFRNTRNGTIFIQTLCEKLKEAGKIESIYDVMMKVIDEVSSNPEVPQVPTVESSMVQPFCFGSLL